MFQGKTSKESEKNTTAKLLFILLLIAVGIHLFLKWKNELIDWGEELFEKKKVAQRDVSREQLSIRSKLDLPPGTVGVEWNFTKGEVVYIPPGKFIKGSPPDEPGRTRGEWRYPAVLTNGLWMWRTEVTQGQFKKLMEYNPSKFSTCGKNCPVEQVTWHEAALFANKLSKQMGLETCFICDETGTSPQCRVKPKFTLGANYYFCRGWRLPTNVEWEYAYRAGTTTPFYTGKCITIKQANFFGKLSYPYCPREDSAERKKTLPVKSFPPNGWGLYDMAGNVSEWVADAEYLAGIKGRSKGFNTLSERKNPAFFYEEWGIAFMARGGSWRVGPSSLRAASFILLYANSRISNVGFRIVKTAERKEGGIRILNRE